MQLGSVAAERDTARARAELAVRAERCAAVEFKPNCLLLLLLLLLLINVDVDVL